MRFLVLGPLEVTSEGAPLMLRRGRARSLVHLLLLHRRLVVPAELVAERLWPGEEPQDGANAVHQLVSYLRRTLGSAGRHALVTTPVGYRLDLADEDVDAWEFEALVKRAGSGTDEAPATALADAQEALALWRGEPFAESTDHDWAAADRARLRDLYLQAQEVRVDALLALGRHRDAVVEAQSLAASYPLREKFHAQHSLGLYRSGRQADALDVHRAVRRLLADELGLDPGAELRRLEKAILEQDPELDWHPSSSTAGSEVPATRAAVPAAPTSVGPPAPAGVSPPAPLLPLVGREHDLEVAARRWASSGLYTVTGPAGVGKSRFVTCLVQDIGTGAGTPVWYVDLGDIGEDGHLGGAVADRLGLHQELPREPVSRVTQALADTAGVLVLDNCDAVVEGAAELTHSLLLAAPHLRVVATSRRPLGLPGEVVHRMAPLPVPDGDRATWWDNPAVMLFLERARHVDADFEVTDEGLAEVADLVRLLDGLPMAVELAAAQIDVSTVPAIRRRLEGQLSSATTTDSSTTSPGASLTAAIDSSVRRLSADEQAFLTALGVFPGFFDNRAAGAVAGVDDETAFGHLASLIRQSLVSLEGDDRYRLLAPVRTYAAMLARRSADASRLRTRHLDWLADVAWTAWDGSRGERQRQELATLRALLPDARVALAWALETEQATRAARVAAAFAWLWTLHGLAEEGFDWLLKVKELSDRSPESEPGSGAARASLLRSIGLLANPLGRMPLARDVCAEAAELALSHGDCPGAAAALLTRGVALWAMDDQAESARSLARAAELAHDQPRSWAYVAAVVLRARTALDGAEPGAAGLVDDAVELAHSVGERQMLGLALACKARLRLGCGAVEAAALTAEEALRVWRDIEYREGEMMALNVLARCHACRGDAAGAEVRALEALSIALAAGHRGAMCESLESLAFGAAVSSRREHALLLLTVASRERARLGAPIPAGDRGAVACLRDELRDALAGTAALTEARAELARVDELVDQLVD